jgi:hypothetical protein
MCTGLAGDGFGATRQMSLSKLIWVVTRIIGSTSRSISTDDLGDHRQVCSALGLI